MAIELFTAVYMGSFALSLVQSILVIWLVAEFDRIKFGLYLQIFALYPVLSACGFSLYTASIMVQSGFQPRLFPVEHVPITSLSHIWYAVAWLQMISEMNTHLKQGVVFMSVLSIINAGCHAIMSILSNQQSQRTSSIVPLLTTKSNSHAQAYHWKLVEKCLAIIVSISMSYLVACLYQRSQAMEPLIRICCISMGLVLTLALVYRTWILYTSSRLLFFGAFTLHMQCYGLMYLAASSSDNLSLVIERNIYAVLSVIFCFISVLRWIHGQNQQPNVHTNFFSGLTKACSNKFTIGSEDDEILLEEMPMHPVPSE